jgi:multimeric flavodoxin WrbA
MKVIALLGSPRRNGNTDIMAQELLRGAHDAGAETDVIVIDDYLVRPIGEVCDKTSERDDPRSDDDFPALLERFLDADIVVWATPVYWAGLSGQLKCFLDRMSSYFNRNPYKNRFIGKGHIILCAYGRSEEVHGKFVTEPMKLVVDVLHGEYLGDVCSPATYQKGSVKIKTKVLSTCYELGYKAVKEKY